MISQQHAELIPSAHALLTGRLQSDLANLSALIFHHYPDLNWAGFYIVDKEALFVGPFQGKPACVEIRFGKGVVGSCYQQQKIINAPDVDAFPGHIACDSASRSELVLPIFSQGKVVAVLDLDSPQLHRFDQKIERELILLRDEVLNHLNWPS